MRHYRIFLILIASTIFVAGLFANDVRYSSTDTVLEVRKAKIAPVIDGVMDPIWRGVGETWMTSFANSGTPPDSKADFYGSFKLMWDNTNLYGFFTFYDDVPFKDHTDTYQNDSWEVYFDADNSKGSAYDGVNDVQLRIEYQKDVAPADIDGTAGAVLTAVQADAEFVQADSTGTANACWYLELKIPLDAIQVPNVAGTKFGFEAQQNDNDGVARDHVSKWWLQSGDASWNNASVFGTAVLSALEVDTLVPVHKAPSAPQIDGVLDNVWKSNSVRLSETSYRNGAGLPDSRADLTGDFRLMWDDANIYGFFTSVDDVFYKDMTNTYENDNWEVYFDGENSKGTSYDGTNDVQLRFEWQKDVAPADIDGTTGAVLTAVQSDAEIGQADYADSNGTGWNLEFRIPLDAVQIPNTVNTVFGFETQMNDNDGGTRDHITKWWLQDGDASWNNASVFGNAILLPGIVSAVPQQSVASVRDYRLDQNYPNPFNPSTHISYTLAKSGLVKLSVYNLLGKEVATLVNRNEEAGPHTVRFNAANLSSGVYFYKLQAGSTLLTRKMMLLK